MVIQKPRLFPFCDFVIALAPQSLNFRWQLVKHGVEEAHLLIATLAQK